MDEEGTMLQLQQTRAHQQILPRQTKDNFLNSHRLNILSPILRSQPTKEDEFIAHIRSITTQMGPEEKEEFFDEAEKEGF